MPLFGPNIKKMKEKGKIDGIIKILEHKDLNIRIEAVKALADLNHTSGLITALKNDNPEVRVEAILRLKVIDETEAREAVFDTLMIEQNESVWQQAYSVFSRSLDELNWGKEEVKVWNSLATEMLMKKRYKNALLCFERVIAIDPDKETIGSIGAELLDYQLYDEALEYFDKVLEIDRHEARAWGGKGNALFNLGKSEEAITCCKKALEINPGFKPVIDTLGALYYKTGDYTSMASLSEKILESSPEDIKARIMLSEALILSEKFDEGESEAQKALEFAYSKESVNPEELGMIHQQLGIIYAIQGLVDSAMKEFMNAIEANSKDTWSFKLLSAYNILNILGSSLDGSPLEIRSRLLNLAEKRDERVSIQDALELMGYE
ncbi:MAG: tetratricopeptide repeat protein [Candidatus Hodarchaeota archaeon]